MLENALETRKAESIITEILKIAHRWGVSIQWIPSHVETQGNDLADELARLGLQETSTLLENNLFAKDVFSLLRAQMMQKTKQWYESYSIEKGKRYFELQNVFSEKPWFNGKDLTGKEVRLINRLMTGHNYSRYWLARMKIVDDESCELCQEAETADHVIMDCPRYGHTRMNYSFERSHRTLMDVLKSKNLLLYKEISDFVRCCKLDL